ncbi:MAG: methyltransferase domain-containing protein [Roseitalea sp.]|jgi:SAM-dependent methyltransferase|nr:methyltransferase domain-containing protein [Roseitalea sp.]MBO6722764.1 methyltransferase domain-containing protein [Roseitalea sp.]MBO6745162.1 methyltransferase domain-containing protein [Roseitalea sp.]
MIAPMADNPPMKGKSPSEADRESGARADAKRIVVLSGNSPLANMMLKKYVDAFSRERLLIIQEKPKGLSRLWRFVSRRYKRRGLVSVADALIMRAVQVVTGSESSQMSVEPDHVVASVNDKIVADFIEQNNPSTVLLNICLLLSADQLDRIDAPVLNVHNGVAPRYRGSGNIPAMAEDNFDLVGATLHRVDAGVDTGQRIAVAVFDPISEAVPFQDIDHLAFERGAELAIGYIERGEKAIPQAACALVDRFYPYPGLSMWLRARRNYHRRVERSSISTAEANWRRSFAKRAKTDTLPLHERLHWSDGASLEWRDETIMGAINRVTPKDGAVLDVGCGEARLSSSLGDYRYFGCDACAEFLLLASTRSVVAAEAQSLPFRSCAFDTVCAIGLFQHLTNVQAVADEIGRITRPGGTILINTLRQFGILELLLIAAASLLNPARLRLVAAIWRREFGSTLPDGTLVARRFRVREIARSFGVRRRDMQVTFHGGLFGPVFAREITVELNASVQNAQKSAL